MGYTHYWKAKKPLALTDGQKGLIAEVLKDHKDLLAWECDEPKSKPEFTGRELRFNGKEEAGHETFCVEFDKITDFGFCKTARKPYDLAVCKCLLILSLSDGFSFSSDGTIEETDESENWGAARAWATQRGFTPIIKEEEDAA